MPKATKAQAPRTKLTLDEVLDVLDEWQLDYTGTAGALSDSLSEVNAAASGSSYDEGYDAGYQDGKEQCGC